MEGMTTIARPVRIVWAGLAGLAGLADRLAVAQDVAADVVGRSERDESDGIGGSVG